MRLGEGIHIGEAVLAPFIVAGNLGIAAMTINASQNHGRSFMHGLLVGAGVAGLATAAFGLRFIPGLILRSRGREAVIDLLWFLASRCKQQGRRGNGQRHCCQTCEDQFAIAGHEVPPAHQKASIALSRME